MDTNEPEDWLEGVGKNMESPRAQQLARSSKREEARRVAHLGASEKQVQDTAPQMAEAAQVEPRHKKAAGWKILLALVGVWLLFAPGLWVIGASAFFLWCLWRGIRAGMRVKRDPNAGSFFFFWWNS